MIRQRNQRRPRPRAFLVSTPVECRSIILILLLALNLLDCQSIDVRGEIYERTSLTGDNPNKNISGDNGTHQKPNILFLMTDQQRFDTIRYVQDRLERYDSHFKINTPNLDRLLASGVYFENAYCQCPVCGPARTSLRTGLTIERSGIQHNDLVREYQKGAIFEERVQRMIGIDEVLTQELDYTTSQYYGKLHLPDVLAEYIEYNDYDYATDKFYFQFEGEGKKLKRYLEHATKIGEILPITEDSLLEGEQLDTYSQYPYYPIDLDSRARHSSPTNTPLKQSEGFESYDTSQSNQMGMYALGHEHTSTYYTGDIAGKALTRLLKEQDLQRASSLSGKTPLVDPWFVTVSFHSPHPPMIPPWKYLKNYWLNQKDLFSPKNKNMNNDDHMSDTSYRAITDKIPEYGDERMILEWTAVYYALIEEIDDQIGNLLSILDTDEYGKENTLIIFTSDHGEMLGSHGKRDKNNFFEESSRVPLFMSYPSKIRAGTHVKEMVGHIDIFETILDYASSPSSSPQGYGSDGKSLRPLIEGREVNENYDDNFIVVEWDFRKPLSDSLVDRQIDERPAFLVRKGSYKLMIHKYAPSSELDMFYDLESDPYEVRNLVGKNASSTEDSAISKAEHLRCLLLEWMGRRNGDGEIVGYFTDPAANFGQGRGDVAEVTARQSWKRLDFWISDEIVNLGSVSSSSNTNFISHQYLYFGTRNESSFIELKSISIIGEHSTFFRLPEELDLQKPKRVYFGECASMRISLVLNGDGSRIPKSIHATLILSVSVGGRVAKQVLVRLQGTTDPSTVNASSHDDAKRPAHNHTNSVSKVTASPSYGPEEITAEPSSNLGSKFDFGAVSFTRDFTDAVVEDFFSQYP